MAAKFFAVICCFAVFNAANSQVLNLPLPGQILPGQLLPSQLLPTQLLPSPLLPNQVILNSPVLPSVAPTFLPAVGPNLVGVDLPGYGLDAVYSTPVTVPATTTIIQDSTVANNLANALQLLVVSNLLSQTLPTMGSPDVILPGYGAVDLVSPLACPGFPGLAGLPAGYTYVY